MGHHGACLNVQHTRAASAAYDLIRREATRKGTQKGRHGATKASLASRPSWWLRRRTELVHIRGGCVNGVRYAAGG